MEIFFSLVHFQSFKKKNHSFCLLFPIPQFFNLLFIYLFLMIDSIVCVSSFLFHLIKCDKTFSSFFTQIDTTQQSPCVQNWVDKFFWSGFPWNPMFTNSLNNISFSPFDFLLVGWNISLKLRSDFKQNQFY